jgi:hypothetical protein
MCLTKLLLLLFTAILAVYFTSSVFAYDDNETFRAGDKVKVSFNLVDLNTLDPDVVSSELGYNTYFDYIQDMGGNLVQSVEYDSAVFDFIDYGWGTMAAPLVDSNAYYSVDDNFYNVTYGNTADCFSIWFSGEVDKLTAGEFFAMELTALVDGKLAEANFTLRDTYCNEGYINVTITPAGNSGNSASYTVSAASQAANVTVGDQPFTVDIKLAAAQSSEVASVQGRLTYDADKVAPVSPPAGVVSGGTGVLNFSKIGMSGSVDSAGLTVYSIEFTPVAAGGAVFGISGSGEFTLEVSLPGEQTAVAASAGTDITVNITAAAGGITFGALNGLPEGYKLLRYEVAAKPAVKWTYGPGGPEMHYAKINDKHYVTYIADSNLTAAEAEAPTETSITATDNDGDINGDNSLRTVDAQIVYDMATNHANYTGDSYFSYLSAANRLKADVNEDGNITTADAYAIQHKLLTGAFAE